MTVGPPSDRTVDPVVAGAVRAAGAAARASGVVLHELSAIEDLREVVGLYAEIWGRDTSPAVPLELLRAFAKAGSYVVAASDGHDIVGACVGFFATPSERGLHSHIAGVAGRARGRNVGFALKAHQRAWALSRGLAEVTWTFDPLVSRNAHFNLGKLAARAQEYLPNFYGVMADSINGSDDTDRLLVTWQLSDPVVTAACEGLTRPVHAADELAAGAVVALAVSDTGAPVTGRLDAGTSLVAVPPDIETLRRTQPGLAREWRLALRETLAALVARGGHVRGFDRTGWYVVGPSVAGGDETGGWKR